MLITDALTDRDITFLLLPAETEMGNALSASGALEGERRIEVHRGDWFYYQPDDDEYLYCTAIPGLKVILRDEADYDKGWSILRAIAARLKAENGHEVEIVLVDKEQLKEVE
jgi:hypothetical protein